MPYKMSPPMQSLSTAIGALDIALKKYRDNAPPDILPFVLERTTLLLTFHKQVDRFAEELVIDYERLAIERTRKSTLLHPFLAYTEGELDVQATLATAWLDQITKTILEPKRLLEASHQQEMEGLENRMKENFKNDKTGKKYNRLQNLWIAGCVLSFVLVLALLFVGAPFIGPLFDGLLLVGIFIAGGIGTMSVFGISARLRARMPFYHSKNLYQLYAVGERGLDNIRPSTPVVNRPVS